MLCSLLHREQGDLIDLGGLRGEVLDADVVAQAPHEVLLLVLLEVGAEEYVFESIRTRRRRRQQPLRAPAGFLHELAQRALPRRFGVVALAPPFREPPVGLEVVRDGLAGDDVVQAVGVGRLAAHVVLLGAGHLHVHFGEVEVVANRRQMVLPFGESVRVASPHPEKFRLARAPKAIGQDAVRLDKTAKGRHKTLFPPSKVEQVADANAPYHKKTIHATFC